MTGRFNHRGISFFVESLGERRWRWEVSPPKCVIGMSDRTGVVQGDQADAIRVARSVIETQTGDYTH